jgi:replicative DNA helicase
MTNHFNDLEEEINRGMRGMNGGVPMGFDRLNKYIGIRKRIYSVVFGATGSGKSAFVHSAYILNPFDWWHVNKHKSSVKVKVMLFSMERSKVYTKAKWLSRKIFLSEGILIPIQKLLGWWDIKMTKDEHDLVMQYSDYINELCEFCDIIEGGQNPTGIYKYMKSYATANGKFEETGEFSKVYIPNNESEIVIPIVDHYGLTKEERGMTKKQAIDKVSEYFQWSRDHLGYSPVGVSQLNREMSGFMNKKIESFEPTLDHIKESGRPAEDADCVISMFQPSRYKTEDYSYDVSKFIDPNTGGDFFRSVKVLKNSYGEADVRIGMGFHGATGMFKELPKKKDMENFDYDYLFNGIYYLEKQ